MSSTGPKNPPAPSDDAPGDPADRGLLLGALAMHLTVFLALVGQGCPPREAAAITLALGLGGVEIGRRLTGGNGPGSAPWV